MISKATDFVHILVSRLVKPGDFVVDATCGNGHDTSFLSDVVGPTGRVLAMDVQEIAIERTKALIGEVGSRVIVEKSSHDRLIELLEANRLPPPKVVLFNLGFLPGSDKRVRTSPKTTLPAVSQAISCIHKDGAVFVVVYTGHEGGSEEADALEKHLSSLDPKQYVLSKHQAINQEGLPPYVLVIQRRF
ncbi:MAG: rRNA methyltransferase [Bacteroidetes bacterium]|nr:rRNA methyltransferase [Bacteroidota bacterium]